MAAGRQGRADVRVNARRPPVRQLPVVLQPLPDELLSSWVNRHGSFFGVSGKHLLRHCGLHATSPRELDLHLVPHDLRLLSHVLRCDPVVIRQMTQPRARSGQAGLIATVRPMQVCRHCMRHHGDDPVTRGARLRSWMEGWRIRCPVCGAAMDDFRPLNVLTRADPADALLLSVSEDARQGEAIMARAVGLGRAGKALAVLMRSLLLPRAPRPWRDASAHVPRLLDVLVPGFDDFLRCRQPYFRRPGTLLLPLSVRMPVLAGIARVTWRPERWASSLIGAAADADRACLADCLRQLPVRRSFSPPARAAADSHLLPQS